MMDFSENGSGAWFVYDGDCPLCSSTAHALRIRRDFDSLHLINARHEADHPLIREITRRRLSLDEGMIIYANGVFYHGKSALKFMARYGDGRRPFSLFLKSLFWSDPLAALTYPWMRGTRNWLLRRRGADQIDNLGRSQEPFFKPIFGGDWDILPPVFKKHYNVRPFSEDTLLTTGTLDVMCRGIFKWFRPIFRFLRGVPPGNEKDVPVQVRFYCSGQVPAFYFDRHFDFKSQPPYRFLSGMKVLPGGDLVEVMGFGLGWRLQYAWEGDRVRLKHRGYMLSLFGHFIPLPLTWLMGEGYGEEWAIDDNHFGMKAILTHPLWGLLYEYTGTFKMTDKETE